MLVDYENWKHLIEENDQVNFLVCDWGYIVALLFMLFIWVIE